MKDISELGRAEIRAQIESLRESLASWPPPSDTDSAQAHAAALEIAASAGMLHRYTGQSDPLDRLAEWEREDRRALALDAAMAFDTSNLVARLAEIGAEDAPEEDDILCVEQALLHLDLLDVALDTLNAICADMLPEGDTPDFEVGDALGQAWLQVDALNQAFEDAGPVTFVAMPIFDGLKQVIKGEDARQRWWFEDGPARLADEEAAFFARLFPGRRTQVPAARDVVDKLLASLTESTVGLAAACGTQSLECRLLGASEALYFELAWEDGAAFICRVYGDNGADLPQAADWDLVLLGALGNDLAVWPLDALGITRVNGFPEGPARRLIIRRRDDGDIIGEVTLDD